MVTLSNMGNDRKLLILWWVTLTNVSLTNVTLTIATRASGHPGKLPPIHLSCPGNMCPLGHLAQRFCRSFFYSDFACLFVFIFLMKIQILVYFGLALFNCVLVCKFVSSFEGYSSTGFICVRLKFVIFHCGVSGW